MWISIHDAPQNATFPACHQATPLAGGVQYLLYAEGSDFSFNKWRGVAFLRLTELITLKNMNF
ncbi:hypothetical protein CHELA40_11304 [Chelatococcus asaccharovorans]|nr:hypothetical protein CHELA40_11304 [Chelatococcus asaccharovorans]CAH1685031.1 hypothetical protein CHELA17_64296 [Chelatococcus asaccharovorans]